MGLLVSICSSKTVNRSMKVNDSISSLNIYLHVPVIRFYMSKISIDIHIIRTEYNL